MTPTPAHIAELEALAKRHGALSYRNRADTQHPAYGFTPAQLLNLLAEFTAGISKQDEALIRQMREALTAGLTEIVATGENEGVLFGPDQHVDLKLQAAIAAADARLAPPPPTA